MQEECKALVTMLILKGFSLYNQRKTEIDIVFGVRWWARYFGLRPMECHRCIPLFLNKIVIRRLSSAFETKRLFRDCPLFLNKTSYRRLSTIFE